VLVKASEVLDYQVRQTHRGVDVDAVTSGPTDPDRLGGLLAHALANAGLSQPQVSVQIVPALERHPETGKVRRFVPLAATA
jgi:hypothetical protein